MIVDLSTAKSMLLGSCPADEEALEPDEIPHILVVVARTFLALDVIGVIMILCELFLSSSTHTSSLAVVLSGAALWISIGMAAINVFTILVIQSHRIGLIPSTELTRSWFEQLVKEKRWPSRTSGAWARHHCDVASSLFMLRQEMYGSILAAAIYGCLWTRFNGFLSFIYLFRSIFSGVVVYGDKVVEFIENLAQNDQSISLLSTEALPAESLINDPLYQEVIQQTPEPQFSRYISTPVRSSISRVASYSEVSRSKKSSVARNISTNERERSNQHTPSIKRFTFNTEAIMDTSPRTRCSTVRTIDHVTPLSSPNPRSKNLYSTGQRRVAALPSVRRA